MNPFVTLLRADELLRVYIPLRTFLPGISFQYLSQFQGELRQDDLLACKPNIHDLGATSAAALLAELSLPAALRSRCCCCAMPGSAAGRACGLARADSIVRGHPLAVAVFDPAFSRPFLLPHIQYQ